MTSTDLSMIRLETRTGNLSARRVWKCRDCRKQFSALTGTVMHGSKIPVRTWVFVMFELMASKNGIAAREIARRYDLCPRSAWHLTQRIRAAMSNDPLAPMMTGEVIADETFIGGSMERMNEKARKAAEAPVRVQPGPARQSHGSGPSFNKVAVLSLIDTASGEVRSKIVPDVTGATLRKAISQQVNMAATTLITDEAGGYRSISSEFAGHVTVNHSAGKYARYVGGQPYSSNAVEGFFSQLKRSLDGTHHHVSRKHLPRYLGEFDFRYSTRAMSDTQRFVEVIGRVEGVRLAYRPLTAV